MKDYPVNQRTIGRILADKAATVGSRPWLQWDGQTYDYASLEDTTNRYANSLKAMGIGRGDHVAVMLPNGPEFMWRRSRLKCLGCEACSIWDTMPIPPSVPNGPRWPCPSSSKEHLTHLPSMRSVQVTCI